MSDAWRGSMQGDFTLDQGGILKFDCTMSIFQIYHEYFFRKYLGT